MLNFTTQERAVVIFLAVTLVFGSMVRVIRDRKLERELAPTRAAIEAAAFDSVSAVINTASVVGSGSQQDPQQSSDKHTQDSRSGNTGAININTATIQELEQLPGIGPSLATRIVEYRSVQGPFTSPSEITAVKGIGDKLYARISGNITIE